jgi:hypothetical protein
MSQTTEGDHMKPIPTLNVNLRPCPVARAHEHLSSIALHEGGICPAAPVLIPCPIPGSFTCEVAIVEDDRCVEFDLAPGQKEDDDDAMCRCGYPRGDHESVDRVASTIRVSCSITSDGTWAGSEVTEVDLPTPHPTQPVVAEMQILLLCRKRWALMKALVMGQSQTQPGARWIDAPTDLFTQRNAAFAAIAKARHHETGLRLAIEDGMAHFPYVPSSESMYSVPPSEAMLAAYVEHLRKEIGALA